MNNIGLEDIKTYVKNDLDRQIVSARVLLDRFKMLDESSRKTGAYSDPTYAPFYYYLGKYIQPKTVWEIGFRLGLLSGCFSLSCKTIEQFLGFQQKSKEYYTPRIGIKNIRMNYSGKMDIHVGDVLDEEFSNKIKSAEWDLVTINEEQTYDRQLYYLEMAWPFISLNGLIVMDYIESHVPSNKAFMDFCKIKNRSPVILKTRYGVGIVKK